MHIMPPHLLKTQRRMKITRGSMLQRLFPNAILVTDGGKIKAFLLKMFTIKVLHFEY